MCWVHFESTYDRIEEVDHILVLLVIGTVACYVKGRRAGRVLGELQG